MDDAIRPGDLVWGRGTTGIEHRAVACSPVEDSHTVCGRKVSDFPVVWVRVEREDGTSSEPIPWPAAYVHQTPTQED